MVKVTKDGQYVNTRRSAINELLAKEGFNLEFFKRPSKKVEQEIVKQAISVIQSVKKDCFESIVDDMSYVPIFMAMKKRS